MKKFYFVGTSPYKFRSSTPPGSEGREGKESKKEGAKGKNGTVYRKENKV